MPWNLSDFSIFYVEFVVVYTKFKQIWTNRLNSIPLKIIRKSTVLWLFQGKQKLINLFRFAKYQWNLATIPCSTWVKSKLFFHLIPDFWWNPLFTEIVITSELEMKNLKLKTLNLTAVKNIRRQNMAMTSWRQIIRSYQFCYF